ncbi:MAG: hypothetical protein U0V72_00540 [Cytophagales bacterium]
MLISLISFSQNLGLSPYSKTTFGDINSNTGNRDEDMGHVGVANHSSDAFSIANPAFLHNNVYPNNSGKFTYFDFSLTGKATTFKSNEGKDQAFGGTFNRIAIKIPINNYKKTIHKWGLAFVVRPYSNLNYNFSGTNKIVGDTMTYNYSNNGSGGLTNLTIGNGIKLSKNLSIGLNTSYIFGKYIRKNQTTLNDGNDRTFSFVDENRMSFWLLQPGIAYTGNFNKIDSVLITKNIFDSITGISKKVQFKVLDTIPSNLFYNIGLTYEYGFAYQNILNTYKREYNSTSSFNTIDTLNNVNLALNNIPGEIKFGAGLSNLEYRMIPNWATSFQISYRPWKQYNASLKYRNTISIGAGYEKRIVLGKNKKEKLTFLRAGLFYNQLPYSFNNTYIDEKGITFGGTLNLPQIKGLNDRMLLSLGLTLGERGSLKNNLIQEKYIKFSLGFTFMEDRWFYRYKLD